MNQQSYSGRYFRTCWNDIKSSQGWFGKICLLGLIAFIPVFGQMTVYGYAYEWAHKAAWGVEGPMPKKIYGRPGSKMLRWGWFALVISVVFMIVPGIVSAIGTALSAAGAETGIYTAMGRYMVVSNGNAFLAILGWIVNVAAIVIAVFAFVLSLIGCIRMTMYDRLGTGFQFAKLWDMMKHDFGGIMRIFGMSMLFSFVGVLVIGIVTMIVVVMILGATAAPFFLMFAGGDYYYTDSAMIGYIITLVMALLPFFLIMTYITLVYSSFVDLLVARAVGYWTRQFDVTRWGKKDDPLPFEVEGTPAGAPSQPAPPQGTPVQGVADTPAPPSGNPVDMPAPGADACAVDLSKPPAEQAHECAPAAEASSEASENVVVAVEETVEDAPEVPNPVLLEAESLTVEPELPEGDKPEEK